MCKWNLSVTGVMWILVEVFHVYDGDNSLREKRYRTVSVPKNASFQSILVSLTKQLLLSDWNFLKTFY